MQNDELRSRSTFNILHSAFCILLFACTSAPPPPPALPPPPPPEPQLSGIASRVVLLSIDGFAADAADAFGLLTDMPLRVHRVIPINPTVTAATHAAILTGLPPEKSGIVANRFHKSGTPRDVTTLGLEAEVQAETLIDVVRRSGKGVGSIAFPTVDGTSPRRTADFGLNYSKGLAPPRVITLHGADFRAAWMPEGWGTPDAPRHPSFSPVRRARVQWNVPSRATENVDLVAYDSTDDQKVDYDTFYVETADREQRVDDSRWFSVTKLLDDGLYGSWSKLLSFDPSLDRVTIYWGSVEHNDAYPASFRAVLDAEAGFWPGVPDEISARAATRGEPGIDPKTFSEQVDRLAAYLTRATIAAIRHEMFALLLTYQPIIDQTEHPFRNDDTVRRPAYAAAGRVVSDLFAALDPASDALLVTGDHGMATTDTEVRLGRLLEDAGLASRWKVYTTGNFAELYRFDPPDDTQQVADLLASLKSPDGAPVFERILRKSADSHPDSGDLAAYAWPRFALVPGGGELFGVPVSPGQHGGWNSHRELHTTLGGRGAGIVPEQLDELPQTEIAPFVRRLLGLP